MTSRAFARIEPLLRGVRSRLPRGWTGWSHAVLVALAFAGVVAMVLAVCAPLLRERTQMGGHDWDQMESHRYLTVKTLRDFRQFPFWNPYACGGHTNWGGLESGVNIVSPWLPFYLAWSLPLAMRIEIVGTALLSALGTWLFAGRFARSPGARAFVCAVFVVNGRWALQASVGHTWHLYYCGLPWVFYFFDRAVAVRSDDPTPRLRHAAWAGVVLALMVYHGGIYPAPQAAFLLAAYALVATVFLRSARPLLALAITGGVAIGLAAPKLLPVLDTISRFPRLVESRESIDLGLLLQSLVGHSADEGGRSYAPPQWGWHEYGQFIGTAAVVALTVGAVFARGRHASVWRWVALIALVLGLGNFHELSPWNVMHRWPVFASQHVPSRWQYPAVLVLACLAALVADRCLRRIASARLFAEVALLAAVTWIAVGVGRASSPILAGAFQYPYPAIPTMTSGFKQYKTLPARLAYAPGEWAPQTLGAEIANVGSLDCSTFPGLNNYVRDKDGRIRGMGARGEEDPLYKGEVFTQSQQGNASIVEWTPNRVVVEVRDAAPGDLVVLNENWDPGWSVDGTDVVNQDFAVAARVTAPLQRLVFRYRSRYFVAGLALCLTTLVALALGWGVSRRRRRRAHSPTSASSLAS